MTNIEKRDELWNRYQTMLQNPRAYGIDIKLMEVQIEDLNDLIETERNVSAYEAAVKALAELDAADAACGLRSTDWSN